MQVDAIPKLTMYQFETEIQMLISIQNRWKPIQKQFNFVSCESWNELKIKTKTNGTEFFFHLFKIQLEIHGNSLNFIVEYRY